VAVVNSQHAAHMTLCSTAGARDSRADWCGGGGPVRKLSKRCPSFLMPPPPPGPGALLRTSVLRVPEAPETLVQPLIREKKSGPRLTVYFF